MTDSKAREAAARAADDYFSAADRAYGEHVACANAAIDAYIAARREEGFVEVPREPTEAMIDEGCPYAEGETVEESRDSAKRAYRAMLNAGEK